VEGGAYFDLERRRRQKRLRTLMRVMTPNVTPTVIPTFAPLLSPEFPFVPSSSAPPVVGAFVAEVEVGVEVAVGTLPKPMGVPEDLLERSWKEGLLAPYPAVSLGRRSK
jgi:hypothetical protein